MRRAEGGGGEYERVGSCVCHATSSGVNQLLLLVGSKGGVHTKADKDDRAS